jgi:pilus assembly protein CpaB
VVNLLVTPEQAEVLSLASNETRIQLVLRNPLDNAASKTSGVVMAALFGDIKPPVAAPKARVIAAPVKPPAPVEPPKPVLVPVYHIEIFNGPQRSEAKFAPTVEEKK